MKRRLLFVIFFAALVSCTKKQSSVDVIKIRMEETLDSVGTGRRLIFHCATSKTYSCANYGIVNTLTKSGQAIAIGFNGIEKPAICLTSMGPATTDIDLGVLTKGTYELSINNGSQYCRGSLVVSESSYKVVISGTSVTFDYDPLFRVPLNTIWGSVGYVSGAQSSVVNGFLDSLLYYGAQPYTGPAGNYFYYQLATDGSVVRGNDGYYEAKYFIYKYSANQDNLKQLVKNFGNRYNDSLWIQLNTDNAKRYLSWMH